MASSSPPLPLAIKVGYAAATTALLLSIGRLVQRRVLGSQPASREFAPAHAFSLSNGSSNGTVHIRPVAPVELRSFTKEDLAAYDGVTQPNIFVSVKNVVYEVMPQLYGPGGSYHVYAGKDISRSLAKSQVEAAYCNKDYQDVTAEEMELLEKWATKFDMKYTKVGWFVPDADYYTNLPK